MMPKTVATLSLALCVLSAGCAERQAQVAVQTSLTSLAHGVVAADEAVAEAFPAAAGEARETMLQEQADCVPEADPDCDDVDRWMARYDTLMSPWNEGVATIRGVRDSLLIAQGAVTSWIESGNLPAEWGGFCDGIEQSVQGLLTMLEGLGVDVPDVVGTIGEYSSTVCGIAGPWFHPDTDEE